jgi:hypothetical protein
MLFKEEFSNNTSTTEDLQERLLEENLKLA